MNTISLISFSDRGEALADLLVEKLKDEAELSDVAEPGMPRRQIEVSGQDQMDPEIDVHISAMRCGQPLSLKEWTAEHFPNADALIFVGACGIAVRAIAPYIKKKTSDPAVVVVDEGGNFAISLLSGHIGGANELTAQVAGLIDAIPVITTATDVNGLFAVDAWAVKMGCAIKNPGRIKDVSAALLRGETVSLYTRFPIEGEEKNVHQVLIDAEENNVAQVPHDEENEVSRFLLDNKGDVMHRVLPDGAGHQVTDQTCPVILDVISQPNLSGLLLIPRIAVLGIGCRKGTAEETIEEAFQTFLTENGLHREAITSCASIDLKAQEAGLLSFCKTHDWPVRFYSAQELMQTEGDFTSSEFVLRTTGADNVCERSAVCESGGTLFIRKFAQNGVTLALALKEFQPVF